jgi:glucosamine 6-phosphate synthetase-like amidotransferase/phosphosugar isomerase protein
LAPFSVKDALPKTMADALEKNRAAVDEAAGAWKDYETSAFFGGGPAWVTAVEAALKMRENNYTVCDGYEVEEIAHGRTAPFQAGRPVIGIVLRGPSLERANDMLATARYCGAPTTTPTRKTPGSSRRVRTDAWGVLFILRGAPPRGMAVEHLTAQGIRVYPPVPPSSGSSLYVRVMPSRR